MNDGNSDDTSSLSSAGDAEGAVQAALDRSIALVGLMGAGKSTVGARLATALGRPFVDADAEIEAAAKMSVGEIFESYGESEFRSLERRVIARLLAGEPIVLATGGGAFMDPETRALMRKHAISVWLRAELDVLMKRVGRRGGRPLLEVDDPQAAMARLMEERYPVYADADIVVDSEDGPHDIAVKRVLDALEARAQDGAKDSAQPRDEPS